MEKTTCFGSGGNDIVHGGDGDDNVVDDLEKLPLKVITWTM